MNPFFLRITCIHILRCTKKKKNSGLIYIANKVHRLSPRDQVWETRPSLSPWICPRCWLWLLFFTCVCITWTVTFNDLRELGEGWRTLAHSVSGSPVNDIAGTGGGDRGGSCFGQKGQRVTTQLLQHWDFATLGPYNPMWWVFPGPCQGAQKAWTVGDRDIYTTGRPTHWAKPLQV